MGTLVSQILSVVKIWPEEVNAFSSFIAFWAIYIEILISCKNDDFGPLISLICLIMSLNT